MGASRVRGPTGSVAEGTHPVGPDPGTQELRVTVGSPATTRGTAVSEGVPGLQVALQSLPNRPQSQDTE